MRTSKTSLKDIANALTVSKATVSFVLNGKGDDYNISKETQKLIIDKAKELAYVPNFFAKNLRQGQTKTIGLILPDITNSLYAQLCKTIQEELYKNSYSTIIINTNDDKHREIELMQELINRSIDAMIIAPSNQIEPLIPVLNDTHIPVVFVDRMGDHEADFVGIDDYLEAYQLIEKFKVKPKHISIIVQYHQDVTSFQQRIKGISEACRKNDMAFDLIELSQQNDKNQQLIENVLNKGSDAIISINNQATFTTLHQLKNQQVVIGKDLRLISFEEHKTYALMNPSISSLQLPINEIAVETVERLMNRLNDYQAPGKHNIFSCTFIERESN